MVEKKSSFIAGNTVPNLQGFHCVVSTENLLDSLVSLTLIVVQTMGFMF